MSSSEENQKESTQEQADTKFDPNSLTLLALIGSGIAEGLDKDGERRKLGVITFEDEKGNGYKTLFGIKDAVKLREGLDITIKDLAGIEIPHSNS